MIEKLNSIGLGKYVAPLVVHDKNNQVTAVITDVPQWLADVVKMRERGISFQEISADLNLPVETIRTNYIRVMNEVDSETPDEIRAVKRAQIERLDAQLRIMWEQQELEPSNIKIVDKIVAIETLRARLLGTFAAEKVDARVITASVEDRLKALDASYVEPE